MDATDFVERMAERIRAEGVTHPVAAAMARAARVSALAGADDFGARLGLDPVSLEIAEAGRVRFGALPCEYDPVFADLDLDLFFLADLAREWRELAAVG